MSEELKNDKRVKRLAELGKTGPASETEEWQTTHLEVQGEGHTSHEVNTAIIANWENQ